MMADFPLFVSHFNDQNQIPDEYALVQTAIVFFIIGILVFLSRTPKLKSERQADGEMSYAFETALSLRGIAILMLCFGHFAIKCIQGFQPYEYAGEYAVIIFLVLSAMGLTKKYGFSRLSVNFLISRIKKLIIPVWITLLLFYCLDYFLAERSHPIWKIILSFFGVINQDPPNGPDWFVTYILFLYLAYYLASKLKASDSIKISAIFLMSYFSMICIMHFSGLAYFKMWVKYSFVFPFSVLVGLNSHKVFAVLYALYDRSKTAYLLLLIFSIGFYKIKFGIEFLTALQSSLTYQEFIISLRPFYLVIFTVLLAAALDKIRYDSKVLVFLGTHSLEIFLLHMPFMVYYDFFLFRKPLALFFFVYFGGILLLSVLLKKSTRLIGG